MKIAKISFVIVAIAAFIIACDQSKPANTEVKTNASNAATPSTVSSPADELAAGKKLYSDNCAICHKDTGEGGKVTVEGKNLEPASLLSDKMKKRTDEKMLDGIREGVTDEGMPAFKKKLTDDQIKEVINYIRKGLEKV